MIFTWKNYLMAVQLCYACAVRSTISSVTLDLLLLPSLFMMSYTTESGEFLLFDEILTPYETHHGPLHRKHRDTRSCQSVKYGNVTHTKHQASVNTKFPFVETRYMVKEDITYNWETRLVYINHQVVNSPLTTWSVQEPGHPGTCQTGTAERATVEMSAQQKRCLVATNAGFFNTHTGQCLGNIVSDGSLVQDSGGIQNVHFGLTSDGYIYTGYLSELDLLVQDFTQLVGGVVWLVRNGENYVGESKAIECPDTEETGSVERFVTVVSARTAVGHDAEGKIHMVQVSGKTDVSGMNLYKFADLLIELGIINAINLDGGGSTTTLINNTLVSFPTDKCTNSSYNCARKVSTILCVHEPNCSPPDCLGHGSCEMGECHCQGYWTGPSCDKLKCPGDCNWHGRCTQEGCLCQPGWKSDNCSLACEEGWYGTNCSLPCTCEVGASCSHVNGVCRCPPGYTGKYCQSVCLRGYFGQNCHQVCACKDSCLCDPVTGSCNITNTVSDIFAVGMCLARQEIKRKHLVADEGKDFCMASLLAVAVVATASLVLNVLLTYLLLKAWRSHSSVLKRKIRLAVKNAVWRTKAVKPDSENDDEDDDIFDSKNNKTAETFLTIKDDSDDTTSSGDEKDLFLPPKGVNEEEQ